MRYLLITLLSIFMLGCLPDSDNPLTDPVKERLDRSIIGTWFWNEDNESGFIHIGLDEKMKLLRVVMVDIDRNNEIDISEFTGHTSQLAGNRYLNLKWERPKHDENPGYFFVKYKLKQDALGIAIISSEAVRKAIADGGLKGDARMEERFTAPHISEQQKKLQEFILRKDAVIFPEMKYLRRLILPGGVNQK